MGMDQTIFAQIAQLRILLHNMETDLGLSTLSRNEKDIFLAFCAASNAGTCTTERVRAQPTVRDVSQPTFHRALKRLIEKGFIEKSDDLPHGAYRIKGQNVQNT
jgi:DNA-binding MarR family transcriptional regulator